MKRRKTTTWFLALAAATLLGACSEDSNGEDAGADAAGDSDGDADSDADADTDTGDGFGVSITLREIAGIARVGELVTLGVPVAAEVDLTDASGLGVIDGSDSPVASQVRITSRWGGSPEGGARPARWLLVDFLADLAAEGQATYTLTDTAVSPDPAIPVSETAEAITVDTGAAAFTVSKTVFSLLESALVGGDELIDGADPDNGVTVGLVGGGTLRSIADAELLATEIAEQGPAKIVIRQVAELEDPALQDEREGDPDGDVALSGVPWLYPDSEASRQRLVISVWTTFVRGSAAVRVRARVENTNTCLIRWTGGAECGRWSSRNSVYFDDLSLHLGLASTFAGWEAAEAEGSPGEAVTLYQDSSGSDSWDWYADKAAGETWERYARYVTFRGFRVTEGASEVAVGDRSDGWFALHGTGGTTVSVGVADPWKHFPVALRAPADGSWIEAGVYPDEWSRDHTLRAGDRKTHEVSLFLGEDPDGTAAARAQAWVQDPVRWSWPPEYGLATRALHGFSLPEWSEGYETWNRVTVDVAASEAVAPSWWESWSVLKSRDTYEMWGKDAAGYLVNDNEQRTSTDLSKYSQYRGFLRQALRNAEADPELADVWWELGVDANRAQADSGYLVQPHAMQDTLWTGINFAHCFHEDPMDDDFPRGAGFGCDFYGDVAGLWELGMLTGYEPAAEPLRAHASNAVYRVTDYYDPADMVTEPRTFGSALEALVTGWRATGDPAYLDAAMELAGAIDDTSAPYLECPCAGDPGTFNALFLGWMMRGLGLLADELATLQATGYTGLDTAGAYDLVVWALDAHANLTVNEIIIDDPGLVTDGHHSLPYYWHWDGIHPDNSSPVYTPYVLMMADGLAMAYRHTGDGAYLDEAGALFDLGTTLTFGDDWTYGVYSTINEAGKFAEFGGEYLREANP